ncbi:MAG: hydrogenase-4 component, partial [Planctomycetota bacterium]
MIGLALAGTALVSVSGVPGLFLGRKSAAGERLAALLMVAGAACGIAGAWSGAGQRLRLPWPVPDGAFDVQVDGITAMFLIPIFLITALGAVYGLGYWRQAEHPQNGRKLRCFYGLMAGGMALQVMASDGLTFLLGFEIMANAAYLTISTEDHDPAVRRTGVLYIVTTHFGALALFAMFSLLRMTTGTWEFAALARTSAWPGVRNAVFLLSLAAFGLKAGAMPLHIWLPAAHATAPSHVSAVMSGVVIKTGIYGLVRVTSFFADAPPWWGGTVLAAGAVSGVLGVAYALGQHDLKRLLAWHSVENIGIILMGLGIAMIGRSLHRADLVALGLAGCLLHVWNHGLFKSLLFFSAGSVIHATHEREIDRLGGVGKRMRWTSLAFLTGAAAICGLPPLNGFVSEFLVYMGLFRCAAGEPGREWLAAAFAAPALALIGGLALACFAKAYGAVFLGEARSAEAKGAHESSGWMLAPMAVLAACCVLIGLAPLGVAPFLDRAIGVWAPEA